MPGKIQQAICSASWADQFHTFRVTVLSVEVFMQKLERSIFTVHSVCNLPKKEALGIHVAKGNTYTALSDWNDLLQDIYCLIMYLKRIDNQDNKSNSCMCHDITVSASKVYYCAKILFHVTIQEARHRRTYNIHNNIIVSRLSMYQFPYLFRPPQLGSFQENIPHYKTGGPLNHIQRRHIWT